MQIKDLIPWARSGAQEGKEGERHPLAQFQEEMNHAFESFWNRMNESMPGFARSELGASGPGVPGTGRRGGGLDIGFPGSGFPGSGFPWNGAMPRADVVETDEGVEVTLELPGLEDKDIEVSLTDDVLSVKGEKKVERKDEKKGFYLSERSYGAVQRSIPLPPGVDTGKAEATFKNGVLTVRLPQSAEARARVRRIDVKAG